MSLCINPHCLQPSHPDNSYSITCQGCGSDLLLQGKYRVMRLLSNETGFGNVYEAYERDVPKILKVLRPDRSNNPKIVHLFQKEAEVLSCLKHPGVPFIAPDGYFTYLPAESTSPLHCIVMEKIDGPNLQQWMHQQGNHPISEQQAVRWLMQLTDVLQRVHQHNYFHRDIKPDNVMLRGNGQLVLVDFGAAREMTQTYLAQVGSLGVTTVSSAGYTPPEQEQGQAVPQSDFYAMGRTIIYLLTGRSPNDTTLYDPMRNAFNWRAHASQLSLEFADLLDSLIAPRVVDRPKTAQEILDRLYQLPQEHWSSETQYPAAWAETTLPDADTHIPTGSSWPPSASSRADSSPLSSQPFDRLGSRFPWAWVAAGGILVTAIGIIAVGFWGRTRLQPVPTTDTSTASVPTPVASLAPQSVELLQTLTDHQNSINALALLSDKRRLISASADATLRLWDLSTGETLQTYDEHTTFVNAIALSPDEQTFYSSSADGVIYQWNLDTGENQAELSGHTGAVNTLIRTQDGQVLASGASDGSIKLWNTQDGTIIRTWIGHTGAVNTLAVTNDDRYIISGGADRTIKVWDIMSGEQIRLLEDHDSHINAIALSPDGQTLFSASADRTIKRWDFDTGDRLDTLTEHGSYVNVLAVSRDGQTISSGSADGTVRVWNVNTGDLEAIYTGFNMPISHLIVPSNKQLITASTENAAIKVWLTTP